LSLEPVDKNLRPLRLNNRLWRPNEYNNTSFFDILRPKIIEELNSINFKLMARETNLSQLNLSLFKQGTQDIIQDEEVYNFYIIF